MDMSVMEEEKIISPSRVNDILSRHLDVALTITDKDTSSVQTSIPIEWPYISCHASIEPSSYALSTSGRTDSEPIRYVLFHILPSSLKSSFVDIDLMRLETVYNILDEFNIRFPAADEHLD